MKKPVIISCGEVLWDLFPEETRFGGAAANFACHAATLGARVSMLTAVGDDPRGRAATYTLQGFGIDLSLVQVAPNAPTGSVGVTLDATGKPTFAIHDNSAWDSIVWIEGLESRVSEADALYFGTLGQRGEVSRATIRRCVNVARTAGVPRVLDVNLRAPFFDDLLIRESIHLASILKLSDEELSVVCSACGICPDGPPELLLLSLLESQHLDFVVMTCGARGAILAAPAGIIHQPGIAVTVRDTVGAGDAFTAAFLLGVLRGASHDENLLRACTIASEVCSHSGAVPNLIPEIHSSR